jgi:PAS domain S-box-containing protein
MVHRQGLIVAASGLLGAGALCLLCTLQKEILGDPLIPEAYVVPVLFGLLSGGALSWWFLRSRELQRKLEAQVAEQAKRLRNITVMAPVGFFQAELDGTLRDANARMASMLGYGAQELGGEFGSVTTLYVNPGHREKLLAELHERGEVLDRMLPLRHKAGHTVWFSVSAAMNRNGGGPHTEGFALDMTTRKHAQDALAEAKLAAEAANAAKTAFLANMSHEIRTPLNGIMGMLQLIGEGSGDPAQAEYARAALKSARRLTALLSDILDLVRMQEGRMALRCQPLDAGQTLRHLGDLFAPTARAKGLEFHVRVADDLPEGLCGDVTRLQQLLANVIGNAIKFTEHGCVTCEAVPLGSNRPDRARVLFTVSDTGVGIRDEVLRRLFEAFAQADCSFTRRHQGAGLGLSICRQLVDLMDGHISVESEPGKGTSMHLALPFQVVPEVGTREFLEELHLPPGCNVLLAEDDGLNQLAVSNLLARRGARVSVVSTGRDALAMLREHRYDVVLLDLEMPDQNGLDVARALRSGLAGEAAASTPAIALTASTEPERRRAVFEAGMDDHLPKPVDVNALVAAILRLLPANAREMAETNPEG